jgi:hypothetical protein
MGGLKYLTMYKYTESRNKTNNWAKLNKIDRLKENNKNIRGFQGPLILTKA